MTNRVKVDFHIHTDASDGSWSNLVLLEKLAANDVGCFAITDHDTTANAVPMVPLAAAAGLRYWPGVEVSTSLNGTGYHVAAYGFDPSHPVLQALLAENRRRWREYHREIVDHFARTRPQAGLGLAEYDAYQFTKQRVGFPNLSYLLEIGAVSDLGDYFGTIVAQGFRVVHVPAGDAIAAIRQAGGHPFLAHPPAYRKGEPLTLKELDEWVDIGIAGIECYSSYYKSREEADYYVNYCRKRGLQMSGGSDYHGWTPDKKPGDPAVYLDELTLSFV